jgi:hypothetical protein
VVEGAQRAFRHASLKKGFACALSTLRRGGRVVEGAQHAFRHASLKKGFACALSTLRRGGRVVEGARLESVYTGNRIAGSNPAPSAS